MAENGKAPRVSILVPTIGRIEYLSHTCDSIEAQTFGDFEVLVLDNASPPESRSVLDAWAGRDARVRVLRVDPRIPMFPNFNRGIEAARGEYVTFCHDDDVIVPEFVARCVSFMDAHPRVGITGSNYAHIDEHGRMTEIRRPVRRTEVWTGRRYIRSLLRRGRNPLTMQSIFYRRVAIGPEGIDPQLSLHWGDFVVLMRIAESWDVGLLDEPLVHVRRHAAQASAAHAVSRGMEMRREMLERYVDELAARRPHDALFIRELRARVAFAHRTGMLWGWVIADDAGEARACAKGLGRTAVDAALGAALRGLDHLAPPSTKRRAALVGAARKLANG